MSVVRKETVGNYTYRFLQEDNCFTVEILHRLYGCEELREFSKFLDAVVFFYEAIEELQNFYLCQ